MTAISRCNCQLQQPQQRDEDSLDKTNITNTSIADQFPTFPPDSESVLVLEINSTGSGSALRGTKTVMIEGVCAQVAVAYKMVFTGVNAWHFYTNKRVFRTHDEFTAESRLGRLMLQRRRSPRPTYTFSRNVPPSSLAKAAHSAYDFQLQNCT